MPPVPALIVTTSQNGVLPDNLTYDPWASQENRERLFRMITGKAIITGRKTFFSLRTMLPKCWIIALSKDQDYLEDGSYRDHQGYGYWFVDNLETAHKLAGGLAEQNGQSEYFVIGGTDIFIQSAPYIQRLYLTTLPETLEGDSFTETLDLEKWNEYYTEAQQGFPPQNGIASNPQSSQFRILNKT